MKKLLFLLVILSSVFTGAMNKPNSTNGTRVLRVGTASGYAPFMSLSSLGEYQGFDKDVINAVAKKMGRKLDLQDFGSMTSLFLALKNQKVDAIIWGISITEERKKELNLVHYQGSPEKFVVAFLDKKLCKSELLSDFSSMSVEAGSFQDKAMTSLLDTTRVQKVDSLLDAVLEVKFGRSSSVAMDPSLVSSYTEKIPGLQIKYFDVPSDFQSQGNGIGVRKGNSSLTSEIEKAIEELKVEGVIEKLETKWGLVP